MKKSWWRYGFVVVALVAIAFGLTHTAHRTAAAGDSHAAWVTAITNQAAASGQSSTSQNSNEATGVASTDSGPVSINTTGTQAPPVVGGRETQTNHPTSKTSSATHATVGVGASGSSPSSSRSTDGKTGGSGTGAQSSAPGPVPGPKLGTFTIVVTVEYPTKRAPMENTVPIAQGETLMDYMLHMPYSVQTAYNGQFITAINGVKSLWTGVSVDQRQPVDWFLYVNGREAPVGADSIVPRPGDVEVWDYHSWDAKTGRG